MVLLIYDLEQFPCCVLNEIGGVPAEPLKVIISGTIDEWATAFIRREYHYRTLNLRYVFGRNQGISRKKLSRGFARARRIPSYSVRPHLGSRVS